jgi:hypothetical protein
LVDCVSEVFGSQAENYEQMGAARRSRVRSEISAPGPKEEISLAEKLAPPQARYVMASRDGKSGVWWDVINPANPAKPINVKGLKKADAEALLKSLLDDGTGDVKMECPLEDEGFGNSFNLYEGCDSCQIRAECEAAKVSN